MSLACRIHGARDLRLEPELAGELATHEVELRLGAGGICGSDLHYYEHGRVGAFQIHEPLIPGHEASGVVARVGAGVTRVAVGQKVAINPSHACGHCDHCRGGRLNLCRRMFFLDAASGEPLGVAVYTRPDLEHISVVHVGLAEEYCAGGERESANLLLKLIQEIRRSARRVKGVRRLSVHYGSQRPRPQA